MWFYGYLFGINLLAGGLTLYDKWAAQKNSWRVKERTLLLVSALGGSLATLLLMRFIRHKTRRPKFMVGLPLIIALQIFLIWAFRNVIF